MPSEYFKSTELDRALMEGLTILESHISPETGYPDWLTQGADAMGEFEADTVMDYALEQLEKKRAEKNIPPGTRIVVKRTD